MSTDDTMRRIEEAVDAHAYAEITGPYILACELRAKLFATIRAALQPVSVPYKLDEEHERAVEAWRAKAGTLRIWSEPRKQWFYDIDCAAFDEALRLMRRQPKETTDGK